MNISRLTLILLAGCLVACKAADRDYRARVGNHLVDLVKIADPIRDASKILLRAESDLAYREKERQRLADRSDILQKRLDPAQYKRQQAMLGMLQDKLKSRDQRISALQHSAWELLQGKPVSMTPDEDVSVVEANGPIDALGTVTYSFPQVAIGEGSVGTVITESYTHTLLDDWTYEHSKVYFEYSPDNKNGKPLSWFWE